MSELEFIQVKEPEYIAELANVASDIFREYFSTIHTPDKVEYLVDYLLSTETLTRAIADEGYEYYFVNEDAEHVGFIGIQARVGYLYLSKLYLASSARGKGYGRQEFEFIKRRAADLGLKKIRLNVARDNKATVAKYEHMGFAVIKEVDSEVGNGIQMNDYVMECELADD